MPEAFGRSLALRLAVGACVLAAVGLALLIGLVAGRPLATDDTWWHLAHGAAYADQGPWLDTDPLLFTAPGPPAPASWLADIALHGVLGGLGFSGLRALHVGLVLLILWSAFGLARRVTRSFEAAACVTVVFSVLAAYRLIQLRPELFTILATLVLARLLLETASWTPARIAGVAALCALWSNLHAGFLLGPVFLGIALASVIIATRFQNGETHNLHLARARGIAAALVAGGLGTLCNPSGLGAYAPLLRAGGDTPALGRVGDEWQRVDWFAGPADPSVPGGAIAWIVVWGLWIALSWILLRRLRSGSRRSAGDAHLDPVLVGLALACAFAMSTVVRLLWLGILPALLIGAACCDEALAPGRRGWRRIATGSITLALAAGFLWHGDGRRLRTELPASPTGYAAPYHAARYFAHATWLLDDAGTQGSLYGDYFLGGFFGYWLAPRILHFSNGSLNVVPDVMAANLALRTRRGQREDESFLELLDRLGIDLYLGTRLPEVGPAGRPFFCTTSHLEAADGWLPVFRNLRSALYLRDAPRNRGNLERLEEFYRARRVPFDPATGFDVARVIREAPDFAVAHGVVPRSFRALVGSLRSPKSAERNGARDRLASLYAVLGLYDDALKLDSTTPSDTSLRRRRRVWLLLRSGRAEQALALVRETGSSPSDPLWDALASAARAAQGLSPAAVVASSANLPFLTRGEVRDLLAGFVRPAPRAPRS